MLFLCLAILSSCAISLLMRLSGKKVTAKLSMLGVNYLICTLLSAAYAGFRLLQPQVSGFAMTVAMGAVNGVLFLGGFMLCQWNTRKNGIVLTSVFMKLGLLVPMAVSVLIFHDLPTGAQIAGFCLALIAIALLNVKKGSGGNRLRWQLPVMLLMCGGADAMSKVLRRWVLRRWRISFCFIPLRWRWRCVLPWCCTARSVRVFGSLYLARPSAFPISSPPNSCCWH